MSSISLPCFRLIPGIGLGDSLLFLPAAFALASKGHRVIIHSHWLETFKDTLGVKVDFPVNFFTEENDIPYNEHEIVVVQNHSPACSLLHKRKVQVVGKSRFQGFTQAQEIFQSLTKESEPTTLLNLRQLILQKAPSAQPMSLAIHPLSHDALKNWPLDKFLEVAHHFYNKGWNLAVFGSSKESRLLKAFEGIATLYIDLPIDKLLCTLASYEIFIGNDSGLGHLASLASRPTFSLFKSRSHALLWRPSWGPNQLITPCIPLPGAFRNRFWKSSLYSWQVIQLIERYLKHSSQKIYEPHLTH